MVWVSNCGTQPIHVSISAVSRGSSARISVVPKSSLVETTAKNFWPRSGPETMHVRAEDGAEQTVTVGPSDFVEVYPDSVIVSRATVHRLGSQSQIWAALSRLCQCGRPEKTLES